MQMSVEGVLLLQPHRRQARKATFHYREFSQKGDAQATLDQMTGGLGKSHEGVDVKLQARFAADRGDRLPMIGVRPKRNKYFVPQLANIQTCSVGEPMRLGNHTDQLARGDQLRVNKWVRDWEYRHRILALTAQQIIDRFVNGNDVQMQRQIGHAPPQFRQGMRNEITADAGR